jgi:hypothetical protein
MRAGLNSKKCCRENRTRYVESRMSISLAVGTYAVTGVGQGEQIGIEGQAWVSGRGRAPAVVGWGFPDSAGVVVGSEDEAISSGISLPLVAGCVCGPSLGCKIRRRRQKVRRIVCVGRQFLRLEVVVPHQTSSLVH